MRSLFEILSITKIGNEKMKKQPKQNADKTSGKTRRNNFNAEELGEQSSYEGETEIAQRMRRGAKKEKGDERDVVGSTDFRDTGEGREDTKTRIEEKSK